MTDPSGKAPPTPPAVASAARNRPHRLAAAGIVVTALGLSAAAGWYNSATNDEPYHILAAWSAVAEGAGDLCVEHPVLVWYPAGLAVQALRLEGSPDPPVQRLHTLPVQIRAFLYSNRADSLAILRVARLAMLPFLALLLLGAYAWARDLGGPAAGLWALGLLAAQPLVLGHGFVVHTDIAAAACWVWTGTWLHRWLRGRPRAWLMTGLWLGLALLAKFSSVHLALLVALVILSAALRPERRREIFKLAGTTLVAGVVLVAGTWPGVRNATVQTIVQLQELHGGRRTGGESSFRAVSRIAPASVPAAHWILGLVFVAETNRLGQGVNYFLGSVRTDGFPLYFPVALALKVTAPFLAALLWAGVMSIRRRPPPSALPLALAAGFFLAVTGSSYNIGARHIMPVLPLLAVAAGCAVLRWRLAARIALALGLAACAAASFPHFIAHFSILAGGSRHGDRYLHDSNLDWGQDWVRLARLAERQEWRPLAYLYLGPADPGAHLPGARALQAMDAPPDIGFVAASRWAETLGPAYLAAQGLGEESAALAQLVGALRRQAVPVARVGHSITVYGLQAPALSPAQPPKPARPPAGDSGPGS